MISEDLPTEKEVDQTAAFNGALDTLQRLNTYIQDTNKYKLLKNWYGYRENLELVLIESQGFLDKGELVTLRNKWDKVSACKVVYVEESEKQVFDPLLPGLLDDLLWWVRLKLHKHHVTMAPKREWDSGVSKMYKKYGLAGQV
jgi:hypothetical protein